jgi:rhamnogalacturonyl hydrolase YesR
MRRFSIVSALVIGFAMAALSPNASWAAAPAGLPSHASVVRAAKLAADYYRTTYPITTLTPRNGWSWSTYFQGLQALDRHAGDARYQTDAMAWGRSNAWQLTSAETNPDTVKAGEPYFQLNQVDPAASLAAMDARMATDLTAMPVSQYDWVDALFMGLPDWALWARRTGDSAYLDKMDALYTWTRDRGATSTRCAGKTLPQPGLVDPTTTLWYRDCTFVGASDVQGEPILWGRGNGWVMAALADVVHILPAGDPRAGKYAGMLRSMAAELARLQDPDGFWRASLHDPTLYPQPESSGTALITYALAAGIGSGELDSATYLPVVARAWHGLSTAALQPSGFVTSCQGPGVGPAAPYVGVGPRTAPTSTSAGTVNADSPPFCVGAFLLAATAVAGLIDAPSTGRPLTFTAQQTGNEARRVDDGDVTTRWSASGFPQSVVVDLGSAQPIGNSMVVPYLDRAYRYRIEASGNQSSWQLLVDQTTNTSTGTRLDDFAQGTVTARYVRLTVVGVSNDPTTWVSIQEFAVYPPPAGSGPDVYAADAYQRTTTNGLGAADIGGSYVLSGPATGFSVGSGAARMRIATAGSALAAYLPSVAARDVDVTVDSSLDKIATGGGCYVAIVARHVGSTDYRAKVRRQSTGALTISLAKTVDGTETALASQVVPGLLPGPTESLRIRLSVSGVGTKTLHAKVWRANATEPSAWQLSSTDATSRLDDPGAVGIWVYVSGTATNAPVTAAFDNLAAVTS